MSIRSPIYSPFSNEYRVACRSNGLWQAQQFSHNQGTRTIDPWLGRSRWGTFKAAVLRMKEIAPKEEGETP